MGPVPADKGRQVLLPAVRKELAVIAAALRNAPGVKRLVKDIHSQPVTGFHQRCRGRIMGCPDGIESQFFQLLYLPGFGFIKGDRAQEPVVMMDAAALQFDGLSVNPQSTPGIRRNGPDTEERAAFIDGRDRIRLKMGAEFPEITYLHPDPVQVGLPGVPEFRVFHGKTDPGGFTGSGVDLDDLFCAGGFHACFFIRQDRLSLRKAVGAAVAPDLRPDLQIGNAVRDFLGKGIDSVRSEMDLRTVQEFNAAVQSGTGIPAGIGLHAGVDIDRNPVFGAVFCQAGQIHIERRISVMLHGGFAAVDLHRSIHHGPVDLQADTSVLPLTGNLHHLRIAGQSAGEVSHIRPGRSIRRDRSADHTVMGQADDGSRIRLQLAD